jgi:hypothetical protein
LSSKALPLNVDLEEIMLQAPPPIPRALFDVKLQAETLTDDPLATCMAPPFVAATHL